MSTGEKNALYQRENVRRYVIKVNRRTNPEIIDHLDSIENVQRYVLSLIKADIGAATTINEKENATMLKSIYFVANDATSEDEELLDYRFYDTAEEAVQAAKDLLSVYSYAEVMACSLEVPGNVAPDSEEFYGRLSFGGEKVLWSNIPGTC